MRHFCEPLREALRELYSSKRVLLFYLLWALSTSATAILGGFFFFDVSYRTTSELALKLLLSFVLLYLYGHLFLVEGCLEQWLKPRVGPNIAEIVSYALPMSVGAILVIFIIEVIIPM